MLAKPAAAPAHSHRTIRIAWWLAFTITIALLVGLGMARSAGAAELALPGAGAPIKPPFEDGEECEADEPDCTEEEDEGEEECELGEDGEEECEEPDGAEGAAPPECLLTTARPRVSVSAEQQRLRLDIRFTLSAPAEVAIGLRSSGGKGGVTFAASRHRLSHSGNLHESLPLSAAETERVVLAKRFTVKLHVLDAPGSCHRYDLHHLRVKHGGEQAPVFSETSADLHAGR